MAIILSRKELMEGLNCLLPPPTTVARGPDDEVPKTAPHLLRYIEGEWTVAQAWIAQRALGICGATGKLITECVECKESASNGQQPRASESTKKFMTYLQNSQFWHQKKERKGPHQHEFPEALLAILVSVYVLSGVAG